MRWPRVLQRFVSARPGLEEAGREHRILPGMLSVARKQTPSDARNGAQLVCRRDAANNVLTESAGSSRKLAEQRIPAVICATTPTPASESTTRYTGATIDISPSTTYCNRNNNRTAVIYVLAFRARGYNDTTPAIDQYLEPHPWRTGLNATAALQVHCPAE